MKALSSSQGKLYLANFAAFMVLTVLVFCISCGVVAKFKKTQQDFTYNREAAYYIFVTLITILLSPIQFDVSSKLRPLFSAMPLSQPGMGRLVTNSVLAVFWFAAIIAGAVGGGKSSCKGFSNCQAYKAAVAFSWFAFASLCFLWWSSLKRFSTVKLANGEVGSGGIGPNSGAGIESKYTLNSGSGVGGVSSAQLESQNHFTQSQQTYNSAVYAPYPPQHQQDQYPPSQQQYPQQQQQQQQQQQLQY
ncbi:hypothetical protein H4219_005692 [Mycoemilia scoparia]|uniref:MARVEL domain-containing protein n=1 Tax=Mycoemilia scoparia TaxID=417184 RepID=A0A9W7ZWJ8_9FUNG|nr:hypothetical protein H4219_005692 [Mycoemilia scoparia]